MASLNLVTLNCLLFLVQTKSVTVNVGFLAHEGPNTPWHFDNVASAITIAMETYHANLKTNGYNHTFRLTTRKVPCTPGRAMKTLADLVYTEKPDVIFALVPMARYLSYWNIPIFSNGGTDSRLSNKDVYPTLVRIMAAAVKKAEAFSNIFRKYDWHQTAMISSFDFCDLDSQPIYDALTNTGVVIVEWIRSDVWTDYHMAGYLERVKQRARVILICVPDRSRLQWSALKKGMGCPDYVFFDYTGNGHTPWTKMEGFTKDQAPKLRKVFKDANYKQIMEEQPMGQRFEDFIDLVPIKLTQQPWNYNPSLEMGRKVSVPALNIHDLFLAYTVTLNKTLAEGGDWRNGKLIRENIGNEVVNGVRGRIVFDKVSDRQPNFWIMDMKEGWTKYKEVMLIRLNEPWEKRFTEINNRSIDWNTEDGGPPLAVPICGFQNEFCTKVSNTNILISASVAGFIFVIVIFFCCMIYRHRKEEEALQQTVWKIKFSEIQIQTRQAGSAANMSRRSILSGMTDTSAGYHAGLQPKLLEVGIYRTKMVAILRVQNKYVNLTRTDLKELKAMKDMTHENLAVFLGACVEVPYTCYIMQYYPRGSLMDIIENQDISLDWMFKCSLLSDLVNGMIYLHQSELKGHGNLKSSCCLVDNRWQLKVSSYGLFAFRTVSEVDDCDPYKLLWTAPELLRLPRNQWPRYGSEKADVYSFGVIAQELLYRAKPHFSDFESPQDIISKLVKGGPRPYRPNLPRLNDDTPAEAKGLIELCWREDPSSRPTFQGVHKMIRSLNQNRDVDIMTTLIEKLEKYANNLENIVTQRTSELVNEKKKTDMLLYQMLPESVAEYLKDGRNVDAELYEDVTIYFSDVVGFTALSLESTPLEVVNLLNDLYSMFDEIIKLHDVYKVETIGDSYMVVSGLPHHNGDRHVADIANLSLDLMSVAITGFKIRHLPDLQLQLRIGFHSGPRAAGVVGLSMPRFCLFGDTVNMASRMETNGEALRIHLSESAFLLLDKVGGYHLKARGQITIKGKGHQMTYWLQGSDGFEKKLPMFEE